MPAVCTIGLSGGKSSAETRSATACIHFEKVAPGLRDDLLRSIGRERYKRASPKLRAQGVAAARSAHEGGWSLNAIGESLGIAGKKAQLVYRGP